MATPLPPLPGETPEQRRARLSAADAVQARIDAQRQAELEAQGEARRKEMQARIDNMLRSAYVLPPLPQLPVPMPEMAPRVAPMIGNGPLRPTQAQIDAYYATGRGGVWDSVRGVFTTSPYGPPLPPEPPLPPPIPTYYDPVPPVMPPVMPPVDIVENIRLPTPPTMAEPPMPTPAPMLIEPPVRVVQPKTTSYVPAYLPQPPAKPGELGYLQPPMPVDPGFVIGPREPTGPIPTYYDPVPPVMPPPVQRAQLEGEYFVPAYSQQPPAKPGELGYVPPMLAPPELRQPTPTPIETLNSALQNVPAFFAPGGVDYGQPAQPSAGMGLSRLAPEPYTPPMAEPYTPPSMQFSVDMPRMDYARDLYGVIPDNMSMLKRGGLAVKPKKGKC
jgi:hypothetical protein